MPDRDILLSKADAIRRALRRIRNVTGLKPESLDNIDAQDIFVLNLQRAVQSAIDLAGHIVVSENLGLPDTIKGHFLLLEAAKIIDGNLSQRMQAMAGFRNIAIHEYQALDVGILKSILSGHLKDLEDFYSAVLRHFRIAEN